MKKSQLFHGKIQARRGQESAGEICAKRHPLRGPDHPWDRRHVPAFLFRVAIRDFMRIDNRLPNQMRPVRITTDYLMTAEGSALIEVGNTRVLCAASVEETVPQFLRGSGRGRGAAEHAMLARATGPRT